MPYSDKNDIAVSVLMVTYNHEKYIRQALDNALSQITDFKFEIIVSDDGSHDNTPAIIKEYVEKYPEIIHATLQEKNIGMVGNIAHVIENSSGKYIAFCDGDDFWHNHSKLKKQYDFMEANSDYGLVYSDVNLYEENTSNTIAEFNKTNNIPSNEGEIFEDLLLTRNYYIKTVSAFIRRDTLLKYFDPQLPVEQGWLLYDMQIWLELAKNSKIKFIPESLATYRYFDNTASNQNNPAKRMVFHKSLFDVKFYYARKYKVSECVLRKMYHWYYRVMLVDAYRSGDYNETKKIANEMREKSMRIGMKNFIIIVLTKVKSLIK